MQLQDYLEQSARRTPNKTALISEGQSTTYAAFNLQAKALANGLQALGVKRGDRVAICLDNSLEASVAIFGALKAGGVFMVMHPMLKAEKLAYILSDARATVLLTSFDRQKTIGPRLQAMPHIRGILGVGSAPGMAACGPVPWVPLTRLLAEHNGKPTPAMAGIDADLASLVYTSGSTGSPKGVMLTHLNLCSAATSVIDYLGLTEKDVLLNVLPLASVYGLGHLLMGLRVGGTVVMEKSFAYPHLVLKRMGETGVTGFGLVPMIAAMLLKMNLAKYDLSHLRFLTSASAPMPTEHLQTLRQMLPHVRIFSMYGQTECIRASYLEPDELERRPSSVGRGMPNQEQYLIDDDGRRVGPATVGELVVRGTHVMKGYWNLPHETTRALRPGPLPGECVLHTGDLFWMDDEGYLYFVSRKDDLIKSRGEKVSPREIEEVLHRLPGVDEVAVIGVPDPLLGQAIAAIIVRQPGVELTREMVLRHCADHLEDYLIPKRVEFHESLPKTDVGKIRKKELRAEWMVKS